MPTFSQRMGIVDIKSAIQIDSMDDDLKIGLWNVLYDHIFSRVRTGIHNFISTEGQHYIYLKSIWQYFFKQPLNNMPSLRSSFIDKVEKYYFKVPWYNVYDFIEFTTKHIDDRYLNEKINEALRTERSGYRLVDNHILQLTSDEELVEIEQAVESESSTHFVSKHISDAIKLLSDKNAPDFRNSMKESISAVESICNAITEASGHKTSTLGAALKVIEKQTDISLHPSLKQAFEKLYGYTSDDGIRHSLKEDKEFFYEDAKFMLVTCSAFSNYLTEKVVRVKCLWENILL